MIVVNRFLGVIFEIFMMFGFSMTDDPGGSTQNSTRNGIIFFDRLQDEALDEASQQTSGISKYIYIFF